MKGKTLYIKEEPDSSGQEIAVRIIKCLEGFINRNETKNKLDKLLHVTHKDELNLLNEEFEDYFKTVDAKHPDPNFDFKKNIILKGANMYIIDYEFEDYHDASYPSKIMIGRDDYRKLVNYNPAIVENNKILNMEVIIVKHVRDERKQYEYNF